MFHLFFADLASQLLQGRSELERKSHASCAGATTPHHATTTSITPNRATTTTTTTLSTTTPTTTSRT